MSSATDRSTDSPAKPTRTSKKFNASSNTDVVFQSSDNVLFHIHRKNLEVQAAGFPPSEFNTGGETVPLSEDAATLENLFEYMYPRRHPEIASLSAKALFKLAEAAEKYEVFNVMIMCKARIDSENLVIKYPDDVFEYASKHNYPVLLSRAAPYLLDKPLHDFVSKYPHLAIPWIRFRECWDGTAREVIFGKLECSAYSRHGFGAGSPHVARPTSEHYKLWFDLGDRRTREALTQIASKLLCSSCGTSLGRAMTDTLNSKLDVVPPFATFLK